MLPRWRHSGALVGYRRGSPVASVVSVWLALDLMVAAPISSELTFTHVSEDDIEADVEEL